MARSAQQAGRRRTRATVMRRWLAWWVSLLALWFLLAGSLDWVELIGGAVAATLGVSAAVVVRDRLGEAVSAEAGWARALRPLPRRVVADWAELLRALGSRVTRRPSRSALREFPYAPARRGAPERSRAALTVFAGSIAPNAFVVTVDSEGRRALVHLLVDRDGSPLPREADARGDRA